MLESNLENFHLSRHFLRILQLCLPQNSEQRITSIANVLKLLQTQPEDVCIHKLHRFFVNSHKNENVFLKHSVLMVPRSCESFVQQFLTCACNLLPKIVRYEEKHKLLETNHRQTNEWYWTLSEIGLKC